MQDRLVLSIYDFQWFQFWIPLWSSPITYENRPQPGVSMYYLEHLNKSLLYWFYFQTFPLNWWNSDVNQGTNGCVMWSQKQYFGVIQQHSHPGSRLKLFHKEAKTSSLHAPPWVHWLLTATRWEYCPGRDPSQYDPLSHSNLKRTTTLKQKLWDLLTHLTQLTNSKTRTSKSQADEQNLCLGASGGVNNPPWSNSEQDT